MLHNWLLFVLTINREIHLMRSWCRLKSWGGLPYVGYTGMCHRPGSIFHFQKSRTGHKFWGFTPEQALLFEVYSRAGSFFHNLVSDAWLKCQNPSCFQLLFPAAWCLHFCSIILEQVFQTFYKWDQFELGHMYSSLNLTWFYHCG